jgi:hypothetical protein
LTGTPSSCWTRNPENDAAFGGAVQLGQHRSGDVDDIGEHPRLRTWTAQRTA